MSTLSVREVCERALRKIGAFSIYDTGADPVHLEEAASWLDLMVRHHTGTNPIEFLVEKTMTIPLPADTAEIALSSSTVTDWPAEGLQFPLRVYLRGQDGNDTRIDLVQRQTYEGLTDKSEGGRPERVYINRLNDPALFVHPVPTTADWSLRLVAQGFAPNLSVAAGGPRQAERAIEKIRDAWDMWLVVGTAAEVGDGPVRKMPQGEVDRMRQQASKLFFDLIRFENDDHSDKPRFTRYVDF